MECIDEPQSLKYNVSGGMKITDDYDEARFIDAVRNVVNVHPAFFVKIDSIGGKPVMIVTKQDVVIETAQADSVEEAKKLFIRPFDLANGPLFRFEIRLATLIYKKFGVQIKTGELLHLSPPISMNPKKIRRLMRKFSLSCPIRKANPYRRMAKAMRTNNVSDNLLNREFEAHGSRYVLLTDITYIPL